MTAPSRRETTVSHVDINRFMGDWYVIANIPTYFETEATNAVESYKFNAAKNQIDIDYHHHEKTPDGPLKSYPQRAWVYDEKTKAEWRVQPLWPLRFAYLIIALAEDYQWTMIGVPNRKHAWIMSRKPKMDDKQYQELVAQLSARGYDTTKLRKVPQT